jgi:hypothetical protein
MPRRGPDRTRVEEAGEHVAQEWILTRGRNNIRDSLAARLTSQGGTGSGSGSHHGIPPARWWNRCCGCGACGCGGPGGTMRAASNPASAKPAATNIATAVR